MNKNAIKSFAIDARNWLRDKIEIKLGELGITAEGVSGVYQQTETEVKVTDLSAPINRVQYENLKKYIGSLKKSYGDNWYNELLEESAYIWFNRIVGIKYMEVNGYLPENINILTSTTGRVEPDIVTSYEYLGYADSLDKNFIRNGILNHDTEGVFRYLFLMENHQLSKIMPFMFAKENDFSDLVFPNNILGENGIIGKINSAMVEEDWKEIEIIGWLYQYYNFEKKSLLDKELKDNNSKKVEKDDLPAKTQLFTNKWIVKYMVENSLGKLALEEIGVRESIKDNWKYYIEAVSSEELVVSNEKLKIEDVKLLDPSMGSGHILVYAFDVLYQIYEDISDYNRKEIVTSIINNNLYGMDIDDRAATLASFALVMKGREYFPRIFNALYNKEIEINTLSIQESNGLEIGVLDSLKEHNLSELIKLIELFDDAKDYGSILKVEGINIERVEEEFEIFERKESLFYSEEKKLIKILIKQAKIMSKKYDVTVTNPPYMGTSFMNGKLKKYVEKNYKNSKKDMCVVFIEKAYEYTKKDKYISMIAMESWMFLSSFVKFREELIAKKNILRLVHMPYEGKGTTSIGIAFGTSAFILRNSEKASSERGNYSYIQYTDIDEDGIPFEFPVKNSRLKITNQNDFYKIPDSPIAYWVSDKIKEVFEKSLELSCVAKTRQGIATGDNNKFIRGWNEIDFIKIGFNLSSKEEVIENNKKWIPYNKGGAYRKWYGNNYDVLAYDEENYLKLSMLGNKLPSKEFYFLEGLTWSKVTSAKFSVRYAEKGFIFSDAGMKLFIEKEKIFFMQAFLNSKLVKEFLNALSPTMNFEKGSLDKLPIYEKNTIEIDALVKQMINISKIEFNSRETSWDFKTIQLLDTMEKVTIKEAYYKYCKYWKEKFYEMHRNEEELNRLFIEIYGLEDEMTPDVDLKDITLLKKELLRRKSAKKATEEEEAEEAGLILDNKGEIQFNKEEIIKQLISYAIGCNMGRYSIDKEGLIIANSDDKLIVNSEELIVEGKDGEIRHQIANPRYTPDNDGIIPVTDINYFAGEDVVERFEEFLVAVYGKENLKENFEFIAEAIKDSNNEPREVLREYFMGDFYEDHLQRYTDNSGKNKRPIYWLVSSNGKGKGAAFNAYIYLHRYNKNTIPAIRGKYVNELQAKLKSKEDLIEKRLLDDSLSKKEKDVLKNEKDRYRKQLNELLEFDKKLNSLSNQMIELDLDDGVKVNYEKLAEILYKVKM